MLTKCATDITTEHGTKCDPLWIEPVIRDFIERGYLTVLRSPHRSGIVGMSTTRLGDIVFDKARLRINSSILHAQAIPQSQQFINNNYGEQTIGRHATMFVENHYSDTPGAVKPIRERLEPSWSNSLTARPERFANYSRAGTN